MAQTYFVHDPPGYLWHRILPISLGPQTPDSSLQRFDPYQTSTLLNGPHRASPNRITTAAKDYYQRQRKKIVP
ncbi:hypothetical protein MN608_06187 [Microdochium nivale]|nr:hypothetical protein MN608_06187 [Microdochium nivale]